MDSLWGILILCHYALVGAVTGNKASEPTTIRKAAMERVTVTIDVTREGVTPELDLRAVRHLIKSMKNPDSFELEEALRMDDGTLCLSYRAANSSNTIIPGRAVISTGSTITSAADREQFDPIWSKFCGNKTGTVVTHTWNARLRSP